MTKLKIDYKESLLNAQKCITQLEKENAELKEQIEKMKCCGNCNNYMHRIDHRCNTECKDLSRWELKE